MNKTYIAEILCVGTELLLGNVTNTNARDLSEYLSALGINVYYHTVVGDNPGRLTQAVEIAKKRANIIITTGGLGPTCDDLTKTVLADAFGLPMEFHEEVAQEIRDHFEKFRRNQPMTENNLQQAWLPKGCTVFQNAWGTAPGCAFEAEGVHVLMLPGPPRELNAMFKHRAMPYLRALSDYEILSHNIRVFGLGESYMESLLRDTMNRMENPSLAPYAKEGECLLRVTARAHSHEEAEAMMAPVIEEAEKILGDYVYGIDVDSLEARVLQLLSEKGKTLAVAESCTGGFMAKRITDLAGASKVFLGGVVSYSDQSKTDLLDIEPGTVAQEGAVSPEVAAQMAEQVREKLGADLGIGITGVAGPESDGKNEVGTVFVALAVRDGETVVRALHLGTGRSRVRIRAANHGFDMVRRYLTDKPLLAEF